MHLIFCIYRTNKYISIHPNPPPAQRVAEQQREAVGQLEAHVHSLTAEVERRGDELRGLSAQLEKIRREHTDFSRTHAAKLGQAEEAAAAHARSSTDLAQAQGQALEYRERAERSADEAAEARRKLQRVRALKLFFFFLIIVLSTLPDLRKLQRVRVNIYKHVRPRKRSPSLPVVQQQHTVSLGQFPPRDKAVLLRSVLVMIGKVLVLVLDITRFSDGSAAEIFRKCAFFLSGRGEAQAAAFFFFFFFFARE